MVANIVQSVAPASFSEAYSQLGRTLTTSGFFMNGLLGAIAIGIIIASWIVQLLVGWILWKLLMLCARKPNTTSPVYNNRTDSAEHTKHVPVQGQNVFEVLVDSGFSPAPRVALKPRYTAMHEDGVPRLVNRGSTVPRTIGAQTTFNHLTGLDKTAKWHGHPRSKYESFVRLTVIITRVLIVIVGTLFSLFVAGIDVYSLVTGFGLVSMGFSYAAAGMISNVFGAIYMYATDKVELHDYVSCGSYNGEITALRAQWIEITDDLQPWKGRMIHQIPNKISMETFFTIYPDGPPPLFIKNYYEDLIAVEKWKNT